MSQPPDEILAELATAPETAPKTAGEDIPSRRRRWPIWLGVIGVALLAALVAAWLMRATIADHVIASQLNKLGLPATYKIASIGPQQLVLSHIVIGNPAHPDLTIERAEVEILLRFGFSKVRLIRARLRGTWRDGKLSLGSLDKVLTDSTRNAPFRFPDLDLALDDARALINSEYGPIAAKLEGHGNLRGGFTGIVAALAPRFAAGGCTADRASLYGKLSISNERPRFTGPARLASLDCPSQALRLAASAAQVEGTLDPALDGGAAKLILSSGRMAYAAANTASLGGRIDLTYRQAALVGSYNLTVQSLATHHLSASAVMAKGTVRAQDKFARIEAVGTLSGTGLRGGKGLDAALASAQRSGKGSLAEPLLAQLHTSLARQLTDSRFAGDYTVRQTDGVTHLVVPQAGVIGFSGEALLAISRLQFSAGGTNTPRFAGNFTTGGPGLPRISGNMERTGTGATVLRITMAEYSASNARLAMPDLRVVQAPNGAVRFAGRALASGPLPGGFTDGLDVPLDGHWTPGGALSLWQGCRDIGFRSLSYAKLTLDRGAVRLCPGAGGSILRSGAGGTTFSVQAASLNLSGRLGQTDVHISSAAARLSWPGKIAASNLVVTLSAGEDQTRLAIGSLSGAAGTVFEGTFADTQAKIHKVPLDIAAASGAWRYAAGALDVTDGKFSLLDAAREDRPAREDRFNVLGAHGARLTLKDNVIAAGAILREPKTDRPISQVTIHHELDSGTGHAELAVHGITFDRNLQPDTLTGLARGVVANARGIVTGDGRINWDARTVSSTGTLRSEGLDFTAAFGVVKGVSGKVEFSDLLGLVTKPDQKIRIASMNPGIEVIDGTLTFELRPGYVLYMKEGHWPFLDGRLTLLPTQMTLGIAEVRRYELRVDQISAARFVEQMELGNLAAIGIFDGNLPLVFDQDGGRIENGMLTSRPPGGNVAYVGELTYRDLSAMGNFAFDALRSIDYQQMTIAMNGDLAGELITTVRFKGVSQGKGAKRNFVTRQIAHLPIQFNVRVTGPFYKLITNFKSLYDTDYVRSPQSAGVIDRSGRPIPAIQAIPQQDIQPPVSENRR